MPGILAGSRAVVFGGGRGIGRATALALGDAGAAVGVIDIESDRASAVADELGALGATAQAYSADVRSSASVDEVTQQAVDGLGGLDVVVTVIGGMAAFAPFRHLHEYSDDEVDLILDVNLRYIFRVARAAIAVMIAQGSGGSIVSIGSISGLAGGPHHSPYGVAKAGLSNLAHSVAAEYGRFGIRMNVVSPGGIDSPAVAEARPADEYAEMTAKTPLGRRGIPEDIADAVVFLASAKASYITGQTLVVDGGMTSRYPHTVQNGHITEGG
jgi:3-oxoacyl-[acyl-carrier protein] reductase